MNSPYIFSGSQTFSHTINKTFLAFFLIILSSVLFIYLFGGGGGANLFSCSCPFNVQARPPRVQRPAFRSRVSVQEETG